MQLTKHGREIQSQRKNEHFETEFYPYVEPLSVCVVDFFFVQAKDIGLRYRCLCIARSIYR